ncbi:hypothetical protein BGX27_005027 [Mortierella sp. AM989]|nr:hypothetical protein BGX27_005027 [Mortierella sp. AM989]
MFTKSILLFAALAATPTLAYEAVYCDKNATQNIVTSITSANAFCTMLTGYGVDPVAPNEGCGSVYCYGPPSDLGPPMPEGYITSVNYVSTEHYVQVTGCLNSTVWAQNPKDEGGQMDSHGWPYSCKGYKKFVSLLEPASNTYCLRCCDEDSSKDCNTGKSTYGCATVIPGDYTMADGSACVPPPGSPNPIGSDGVSVTSSSAVVAASATAESAAASTHAAVVKDAKPNNAQKSINAGSRASSKVEAMGAAVAVALAVAAAI